MEQKQITDHGLVSIIMPLYNAADFVKETIESVLAQTYQNWELLITNDCSTDHSVQIVRSFDDLRIKLFHNEKNSGAATTRNTSIAQASGRWIAFLDSDDLWDKEKLEKHLDFMVQKNAALSMTHYRIMNGEGEIVKEFCPEKEYYVYKDVLKQCTLSCSTVIYDAQKLGKVLMPQAEKREDLAYWLLLMRDGEKAWCLPELLTTYKVHANSVSSNKGKMIKYQWRVYRRNERIGFVASSYYLANWAIRGFLKYRK